jgi:hypothetical protein
MSRQNNMDNKEIFEKPNCKYEAYKNKNLILINNTFLSVQKDG